MIPLTNSRGPPCKNDGLFPSSESSKIQGDTISGAAGSAFRCITHQKTMESLQD